MPTPYRAIQAPTPTAPSSYTNTSDPRKAASSQLQNVAATGNSLIAGDQNLASQYRDQSGGVEDYLNPIQSGLAEGNGGYNPTESAAINYSPEQQQNLVTGAGISAGTGTAAAVGAAGRAADASGGSPMALAAYRQRAAQTEGAQAGDAMTKARVAAHDAAAAGAKTTGDARLGQQNAGLGYYANLQAQKNQDSQNESGLAHGAYGTQTAGTGAATGQVLQASQTPSTFDKVLGTVAGVAKGAATAGLADGTAGYLDDGMDAVVGENGPEAIVEAASNPHGNRTYMDDGGDVSEDGAPMATGVPPGTAVTPAPWLSQLRGGLQNYLRSSQQSSAAPAPAQAWNPTTPYTQAGDAAGSLIGKFLGGGAGSAGDVAAADGVMVPRYRARPHMADGGFGAPRPPQPPKIVTSPTNVHLNKGDSVVPLSFRSKAKVRPSIAVKAWSPQHAV